MIAVVDVLDDDRHALEAGALRRTPTAFAGDDLVALARQSRLRGQAPDDDRLDHAVGGNRLCELGEAFIVVARARLVAVGLEDVDVDLERRARLVDGRGRVRDERAQTFAESRFLVHVHTACCRSRNSRANTE